ncbi:MAG: alpha/beta hydrolase [Rhizobiaceae bacterium]|nr:alpha/beta hydrolase [Rhizobiaceae bacterium]
MVAIDGIGTALRRAAFMVMVALTCMSVPAAAQSFDPLLEVRIAEAQAAHEPDKALGLVEAALAASNDARLTEDLLARKAEILIAAERHAQAGAALEELGAAIIAREGETAPELIPVLEGIADAYEAAGRPGDAVAALSRLLDILDALDLDDRGAAVVARLQAIADAVPDVAARIRAAVTAYEVSLEDDRSGPFGADPETGFTAVKIFYATDRARTGDPDPANFYGGERGTLELGTATVSIPPRHVPGKIERPKIWLLEFREDPAKHVILKSVTPGDSDAVFAEMRDDLAASESDSAFVFVHGFNVPFNEAAQRTAQMAYDMNFSGVPILYSWPSRGSLLSYIADTAVVNLSGRRLTLFLEDVVRKSGARRVHLIAHSMGNRALTDALELYALRHEGEPPAFDQVLFTAPDLDAGLFVEMAKTIKSTARRMTLYASNKDWALAVSRKLHGDAARAGQGGNRIIHADIFDSVDMTSVGDDMLAHSYYANNPSALTDILSLFWRDAPPQDRCGMVRAEGEFGNYWQYSPEVCGDTNALLSTLSVLNRASIVDLSEARAFLNRFIMPVTADPEDRSRLESALARLFGN